MTSSILNKFRNIAFGISGIGFIGSVILGLVLSSGHYFDCTSNGGSEAYCQSAYFANVSYGKFSYYGFLASIIAAFLGVVLLAIWIVMWFVSRNKQDRASLTPEQIELRVAEKEYASSVKEAEKAYKMTVKNLQKTVKQSEKAVKAADEMGQRKLAKFHSAVLYEDRVETPQGTALFDTGIIETDASPNGNLNIRASSFQSLIEGKPEQFEKAREFVVKIQTAYSEAPKIREEKLQAVAQATSGLEEAQRSLETGTIEAEGALAEVKAGTSRVEAARAMMGKTEVVQETI